MIFRSRYGPPEDLSVIESFLKKLDLAESLPERSRMPAGICESKKFDLMFFDLRLLDAPGDQVYKTAKHLYPDLKV